MRGTLAAAAVAAALCAVPAVTEAAQVRPAPRPAPAVALPSVPPQMSQPAPTVDPCRSPAALVAAGDTGLSADAVALANAFAGNATRVSLVDVRAALEKMVAELPQQQRANPTVAMLVAVAWMKVQETLQRVPPLPGGSPDPFATLADVSAALARELDRLPDAPDTNWVLAPVWEVHSKIGQATTLLLNTAEGAAATCQRRSTSPTRAYAQHYGTSEEEADRRLDLQERVPDLEGELVARLGDGFTQAWFDNDAGRWVVAISPRGDVERTRSELEALGLGGTEIVQRPFTRTQLMDGLKQLTERLGYRLNARQGSVGLGAGRLEVRVAKGTPAETKEAARTAARESGVDTLVEERPDAEFELVAQQACVHPYCERLLAGIRYLPAGCTAAFYVGSPVDSRPFMLTAGHCVQQGRRWGTCTPNQAECWAAGHEVGRYYGGGGGDGGVMRVDWSTPHFTHWAIFEGWVNWWNQGITSPSHYFGENAPNGTWLCHQGATTQSSCGVVSQSSRYVELVNPDTDQVEAQLNGMIEVTGACSGRGDSGGPWTMRDQRVAAGIHSGGSLGPDNEPVCGGSNIQIVEPVHRALQTLNVHIYGRP